MLQQKQPSTAPSSQRHALPGSTSKPDSWQGFVFFAEEMCRLTARDHGLREALICSAYGADRIEAAHLRLEPMITKLVDRAKADGHLRADICDTDLPFIAIVSGAVTEFAGDIRPELWRRYVAIFLDGMRARPANTPLPVPALDPEQHDAALRSRNPTKRR